MSLLQKPTQGLFVGSFLYREDLLSQDQLRDLWEVQMGDSLLFKQFVAPMKKYYSREMGDIHLLKRFFILSKRLCERDELVFAKKWSTDFENNFLSGEKRKVNLDIGLLTLENFTLATGKNFVHRVYLGEGVFSDLNLIYKKNSYEQLDWTYPDYCHHSMIDFLNWSRSFLTSLLKK